MAFFLNTIFYLSSLTNTSKFKKVLYWDGYAGWEDELVTSMEGKSTNIYQSLYDKYPTHQTLYIRLLFVGTKS